jgi:protease-4
VSKAAESRGVAFEEFEPYARGRVWMAEDAMERGLVDQLGGLEKAIDVAAERAGLESFSLLHYPEFETFFDYLDRIQQNARVERQVGRMMGEVLPCSMRGLFETSRRHPGAPYHVMAISPLDLSVE